MKRLFQFIIFVIVLPFIWILRTIPLRMSECSAQKIIGFIGPYTPVQKTVMKNLSIVFPNNSEQENFSLSKKLWKHIGIILAQAVQMDNPVLVKKTKIFGLEHLQKAHNNGNGVIIISAHIGAWDVMCASVKENVAPCDVVYRPIENPFLNKWFESFRVNIFNRLIVKSPSSGREILKSLKQGNIIAMLSDQKMWGHTVAPFFNKDAECADGAVRLGYKLNTPVIPVHSVVTKDGYEMHIEPPMNLTGDLVQDTTQMNTIFERWILQNPEQYFNFTHNKWN